MIASLLVAFGLTCSPAWAEAPAIPEATPELVAHANQVLSYNCPDFYLTESEAEQEMQAVVVRLQISGYVILYAKVKQHSDRRYDFTIKFVPSGRT